MIDGDKPLKYYFYYLTLQTLVCILCLLICSTSEIAINNTKHFIELKNDYDKLVLLNEEVAFWMQFGKNPKAIDPECAFDDRRKKGITISTMSQPSESTAPGPSPKEASLHQSIVRNLYSRISGSHDVHIAAAMHEANMLGISTDIYEGMKTEISAYARALFRVMEHQLNQQMLKEGQALINQAAELSSQEENPPKKSVPFSNSSTPTSPSGDVSYS